MDTLARKALWDVGLDYAHGTGHGVGHFLNVHEGPSGVSWRPYPHDPGLKAGQILSNGKRVIIGNSVESSLHYTVPNFGVTGVFFDFIDFWNYR